MMLSYVQEETLDDVLRKLYPVLLESQQIVHTSRGPTRELVAVLLELSKPRARLSRTETRGKPFSCLGELCWYLSGDNTLEFITHYIAKYRDESDDHLTVHGAYGPRLLNYRGQNQLQNVIRLLRKKPSTRRAVIQLFDAEDIGSSYKEIPCTTTLQFLLRNGVIDLIVTMRSNDAYKGLPHDIFCFTMVQEIVARSVGADLGIYRHFVGSMHLYEHENANDADKVRTYLEEGVQPRIEMPTMPTGDPWPSLEEVLRQEKKIRMGNYVEIDDLAIEPFWLDLLRLLQVFSARGDDDLIDAIKAKLNFAKYGSYIQARKGMPPRSNGG